MKKEIVIRMYDVGFGDSFLIRFPSPDRKRELKMLVDCGSFKLNRNKLTDVVKSIVATAKDEDGVARLDVVVCTHRHKDHVSGFTNNAWSAVQVKEVWMPWTEQPDADDAKRLRLAQTTAALRLSGALAGVRKEHAAKAISELALANEAAMQTLWFGFDGHAKRRYLPPKEKLPLTFHTTALPGAVIHVLGPSHDEKVIGNLEPPSGQSYLQGLAAYAMDSPPPFARDVPSVAAGQFARNRSRNGLALSAHQRREIEKAGEAVSPLAIAARLDSAINGTSLMFILEIGKAKLLFPGDAQWGTWEQVLTDPKCRELVKATTFYKAGHHASHNGTPAEFVDALMRPNSRSMVSVHSYSGWPGIPRGPLLTAMGTKCQKRVVRSDKAKKSSDWYTVDEDEYATFVETAIRY